MSANKAMQVRHKAQSVESSLRQSGVSFLQNDDEAYAVYEEVMRNLRGSDLKVESPRSRLGGEYVFRSETRLAVKQGTDE